MSNNLKFLIDENLAPQIAKGMAGFGQPVIHIADCEYLGKGVQDTDLLEHIGNRGWFLLTHDKNISKKPAEKHAFMKYQIGAFFLGGKDRSICSYIQQLVRNWPRIKELAARKRRPFAYRIPPNGTNIKRIPL